MVGVLHTGSQHEDLKPLPGLHACAQLGTKVQNDVVVGNNDERVRVTSLMCTLSPHLQSVLSLSPKASGAAKSRLNTSSARKGLLVGSSAEGSRT